MQPPESLILYTIGYQGRAVADIVQAMRANRVEILIDVRSKPNGRRFEFNRKALEAGIPGYHFMGDRLGGFGEITDQAVADLAALATSKTALLMCFEADHNQCHRHYDLGVRLQALGFTVVHL